MSHHHNPKQAGKEAVICGENIARDLITSIHDDTIGMFVFAGGLTVNFDRFKDALESNLKPSAG
jgi:hypothetical protein